MQPFHVTGNLKQAAAFATIGAEVLSIEPVRNSAGRDEILFTLAEQAHGITCQKAAELWDGKGKARLDDMVDEILVRRSVTPEEYAVIQLDACRAALGNRGVLLKAGMNKRPLICKTLKSGRQVIYRDGTPRDELKRFINS